MHMVCMARKYIIGFIHQRGPRVSRVVQPIHCGRLALFGLRASPYNPTMRSYRLRCGSLTILFRKLLLTRFDSSRQRMSVRWALA